jgi:hypothetical protein
MSVSAGLNRLSYLWKNRVNAALLNRMTGSLREADRSQVNNTGLQQAQYFRH